MSPEKSDAVAISRCAMCHTLGAGCGDPQEDPGRQPGAALRVLKPGVRHCGPLRSERVAAVAVQPVAGLAQAAEREQVKTRDRSYRSHDPRFIAPDRGQIGQGSRKKSGAALRK